MKKIFNSLLAILATSLAIISCAKSELPATDAEFVKPLGKITVSAILPENMTKVAFDPAFEGGKPTGLSLTWEEGDLLCVYDAANKEKNATLELASESVGQKEGLFSGDVNFSAESYYVEVLNQGEVADYAIQTQPADGQTAALKYRAYATTSNLTDGFILENYTTPLAITAKLPSSEVVAAVKSVTITASEAIFNGGNTLTITLDEIGDAGEDGILHLYVNLPEENPAITEGTTLLVKFNTPDTDHKVYTRYVELGAAAFEAGKLNTININASCSDVHAGLTSCDGTTEDKAYLIADKYQMKAMLGLMQLGAKRYFKMVADVDLNGEEWTPLNCEDNKYSREIHFDGQNHTISNLKSTGDNYPSFAGVLNGTIKNVTFEGATIVANTKAGGVIGYVGTTNITGHCNNVIINNANVSGSKNIGAFAGIVGNASSTFTDCQVTGNTILNQTVNSSTGGFVGYDRSGATYTRCKAFVSSVSGQDNVGGFIGQTVAGQYTDCESKGEVTAKGRNVGGFVGNAEGAFTFDHCIYRGTKVESTYDDSEYNQVGGFCGGVETAFTGKFTRCWLTAGASQTIVESKNDKRGVGGFIGRVGTNTADDNTGTIEKCRIHRTQVEGGDYTGGFVGVSYVTITQCGVTDGGSMANVISNGNSVGGFAGYQQNNQISYCYNDLTKIEGVRYVGGFVGNAQNTTITESYVADAELSGTSNGSFIGNAKNGTQKKCISWIKNDWYGANTGSTNSDCHSKDDGDDGKYVTTYAALYEWDTNIWNVDFSQSKSNLFHLKSTVAY